MSHWGLWILSNCDNDMKLSISGNWFFASEKLEIYSIAKKLGVTII